MENKHTQYVDFSNPNADKITSGVTNRPMENKKQTAVEWFFDKLENHEMQAKHYKLFQQAKEMHKEQIKDAYDEGDIQLVDAEQYYNQTYGKDNEQ